jgi:acyl carrier protein
MEISMNDGLEIVRGFLQKRLGVEPSRVKPEAKLPDLDIDSMILLELFFEFEERLGLNLSRDIPTPKTIGDLLETVKRLQTAKAAG